MGLHLRSRRKLWKSDHENWGTCARAAARGKAWYVSAFEPANAEAVAAFAEGPIYKLPKESTTKTHVVSAFLRRGEDPDGAVQSTEDAFADLLALSRSRCGIVGSWGSTFTWAALAFAGPGVARLSIKSAPRRLPGVSAVFFVQNVAAALFVVVCEKFVSGCGRARTL